MASVLSSAKRKTRVITSGERITFIGDKLVRLGASIDIFGDDDHFAQVDAKDKQAIVNINGKTTVIPAPAGIVRVNDGKIYQNNVLYVPKVLAPLVETEREPEEL